MMKIDICNSKGEKLEVYDADNYVWGAENNEDLLHQVVTTQQANQRLGTHSTQTRANVSYSTKKLRPQKGTGNSRQGSARSSIRVGGGVAHGPHPRSYRKRLPKKMKRQALRIALSNKYRSKDVQIIDKITFKKPNTKEVVKVIENLKFNGKTLIIMDSPDTNILMSVKNINNVDVQTASMINPLQTLKYPNLLFTKDAVQKIEKIWGEK
ncbi:MAG: 50S ribosomal protein L4 [Chloroflexi bacterium]|nr:50S ribosomal protein L4 [Chloroflexota bacterium]